MARFHWAGDCSPITRHEAADNRCCNGTDVVAATLTAYNPVESCGLGILPWSSVAVSQIAYGLGLRGEGVEGCLPLLLFTTAPSQSSASVRRTRNTAPQ